MSNATTPVKFVKIWRQYNPDEIAGFEPETAKQLVEKGFAVELKRDSKTGEAIDPSKK